MKKKNRNIILVSSVIIGLIILLAIFGKLPFAIYGDGLTIKSMSTNTVISQDTDLKGVWWVISAYTGGGQSISGTLTPEQTKQLTSYQTQYPLNIKVSALNEKIN